MNTREWDIIAEWKPDSNTAIFHLFEATLDNIIRINTIGHILDSDIIYTMNIDGKDAVMVYGSNGEPNYCATLLADKVIRGSILLIPKRMLEKWED